MAFIGKVNEGTTYNPGFFLAYNDEGVVRETREIAQNSAAVITSEDGTKHVPGGTAYPSNDGNAIGILYEDVDVTVGNMPGSVITGNATVYLDRLPVALDDSAKTALAAKGFNFVDTVPAVTRPY